MFFSPLGFSLLSVLPLSLLCFFVLFSFFLPSLLSFLSLFLLLALSVLGLYL
jgi:hypothetical protein